MPHMNKTLSPPSTTSKPPRVSVPVTAEVLAIFERLAKAGNMSTGRAMAGWLSDTVEAAEYMASTLERAREAPKVVIQELQAYTLGLTDELSTIMDVVRRKGVESRAAAAGARLREGSAAAPKPPIAQIPPSCNTGGKLPKGTKPKLPGGSS